MRALIASSSTGGHIYPALAVVEEIVKRDPGAEILFVGTKWEVGKNIVEESGYRQAFIEASGFDRKNPFKNIAVLADVLKSSKDIKNILKEFDPDVVIGSGGYVSGPVLRIAKKRGFRTFLMEQNVMPGTANLMAEKYADRVFVAFKETAQHFKKPERVIVSGNPVRSAFAEAAAGRDQFREKYGVPKEVLCVLMFGGSQGAEAMNSAGIRLIESLGGREGCYVILITGRQMYPAVKAKLEAGAAEACSGYKLIDYSDVIYELFAAADLIISRAGALTVTEIAHSGKASILIPSPNVTKNHQYYNAKALMDAGAAMILTEEEMIRGGLTDAVLGLAADREKLGEMGVKAAETAKADAAQVIVNELFGN